MPTYKKQFNHKFLLNGTELQNVSIGASAIGKFEEPLDEAGLHLPFTVRDYEYPMRGLLEIISEDYKGNVIENTYIILSDEVEEGSKYGEWKHNLRVMEYSGKYDAYLYHTFTYTKALKNNNPAPFEILQDLFWKPAGVYGDAYAIPIFLDPINIISTYYADENITLPQVSTALQATDYDGVNLQDGADFEYRPAYVMIDGDTSTKHTLSSSDYTFQLEEGQHYIDYGFSAGTCSTGSCFFSGGGDIWIYRFYVNAIPRSELSVLDALNIIRDSKPFESKLYHSQTRLFNIDPNIETYLASVEMPQMFLQKATMRQILNTIFSYVNAISRFYYNDDDIDTLSMDEFNKVVEGVFDIQDVIAYNTKQEAVNLFNQGVVWGERILPTSFEEATITSPAENLYKTVRSTQVQLVDTKFGIELESELYQPVELKVLLDYLTITPYGETAVTTNNYVLDLTSRLINREEWYLKQYTLDFPVATVVEFLEEKVGLRENRVSHLYWTQGATTIDLSEIVGEALQTNIVFSTIQEAMNEYLTRNIRDVITPNFFDLLGTTKLNFLYSIDFEPNTTFIGGSEYRDLKFQFKYISFENFSFQTHRENTSNNLYYSEGRLNQTDKALNISFASMRAHGDTQRSGVPNITFSKIYDDYDNILRWGMIDDNDYVIVEEKFEFHNEYVKATYTATQDHNRLSLWTKVDQEYRWTEIPRTNQVFERHELFNENILVTNPNKTTAEEDTMITQNAIDLMFGTLMNDWDNTTTGGKTKITLAYVRTDGFIELYPDEFSYKYMILTPVRSFGGKHGFTFLFGFDGNQVAGNQIEEVTDTIKTTTYWNKAVRYTNERGEFNELWFMFTTKFLDDASNTDNYTDAQRYANYPLTRLYNASDFTDTGFITHKAGDIDFDTTNSNVLMFGKKDKSQSIKVSIQNSVVVDNYKEYVFGLPFYSNNFIVNNPEEDFGTVVGTPMYVYLYSDGTTYGKFDLYKVKSGYDTQTLLVSGVNVSFTSNQFRFDSSISLTNVTSWAIGDGLGNLYLACNRGYNGFNVYRMHFYPNQDTQGLNSRIRTSLFADLIFDDEYTLLQFEFPFEAMTNTLSLDDTYTLEGSTNLGDDYSEEVVLDDTYTLEGSTNEGDTFAVELSTGQYYTIVSSTNLSDSFSQNISLDDMYNLQSTTETSESMNFAVTMGSTYTIVSSTNEGEAFAQNTVLDDNYSLVVSQGSFETFAVTTSIGQQYTIVVTTDIGDSLTANTVLDDVYTIAKYEPVFESFATNVTVDDIYTAVQSRLVSETVSENAELDDTYTLEQDIFKHWKYTGTTGTYNLSISYDDGSGCPTQATLIDYLESTYPADDYAVGYRVRVARSDDGAFCSPLYYYFEVTKDN